LTLSELLVFPPLLPQPMTNGLTAISRANCLRL
jgi:hypothetical protein